MVISVETLSGSDVQDGYDACSKWARRHNKSPETNYVPPEPDEMKAEVKRIEEWQKRMKKDRRHPEVPLPTNRARLVRIQVAHGVQGDVRRVGHVVRRHVVLGKHRVGAMPYAEWSVFDNEVGGASAFATLDASPFAWQPFTGIRPRRGEPDRPGRSSCLVDAVLAAAGIRTLRSPVRAPRAIAIMERWIGSCRRELLDQTLIWNQRHLRQLPI
jgi:hypothetical protein